MGKTALFLGGGAPNLTLMSGALLALHEAKVDFDIVAMAGAGAVVGLVYLAPSGFARNDPGSEEGTYEYRQLWRLRCHL